MNNKIKFKNDELDFIISLTNEKLNLKIDNGFANLLYKDKEYSINVTNYIYNVIFDDNKLKIYGKINTLLWKEKIIKLYIEYKGKRMAIGLECNQNYLKDYSYNYMLNMDYDIGEEIKFILKYNNKEISFLTKGLNNIVDNKIIAKNIISINNNCLIIRKVNLKKIILNKYLYKYPITFSIINIMSLFVKSKDLYLVSKKSSLYNDYVDSSNKNKIFFESSKGLKYKLNILRAKKIITDKDFNEVYPFGTMTKYYIRANSSEFICRR